MSYVRQRAVSLALMWVVLSVVTFGLEHAAPGDPGELALQHRMIRAPTAAEIAGERHRLGLDQSIVLQYGRWVARASHGDFGDSWQEDRPVSTLLAERLPRTALLALVAFAVGLAIAVPLGVVSARFHDSWPDHVIRLTSSALASCPGFVLAYLLIYLFGVRLQLLPVFGFGSPRNLVLPALTLSLASGAGMTRLTRSGMLEVLEQDFVRTAKAKGASARTVLWRHALRNALNPLVSLSGLHLGYLLSGTVIVESIFAWPGIGKLALDAIYARDYPVVQGFTLLSATVFVAVNLLVDVAYLRADPRVRMGGTVP